MGKQNGKLPTGELRIVAILALANVSVYGLPFMKNQFYNIMLAGLGFSNSELSALYSIYGLVCMIAYLVGGLLADLIPVKTMMVLALGLSGILHLSTLFSLPYALLCVVFGLLGVTSVMAFYPASVKVLSCLEDTGGRGLIFGIYIAIVNAVSILVVLTGTVILNITADPLAVFRSLILFYVCLHVLSAVLLMRWYTDKTTGTSRQRICFRDIPVLLANRNLWLVTAIIFTNYLLQSTFVYLMPYLSAAYQLDERVNLLFSIVRINLVTMIFAPLAGRLADTWHSATSVIGYTFVLAGISMAGVIISLFYPLHLITVLICVLLLSIFAISGKSIAMVTLSEIQIPPKMLGTAIGIVSFLGYSSDGFYYSLAGSWLDTRGAQGYLIIFALFIGCCVIGGIACACLRRRLNQSANKGVPHETLSE